MIVPRNNGQTKQATNLTILLLRAIRALGILGLICKMALKKPISAHIKAAISTSKVTKSKSVDCSEVWCLEHSFALHPTSG